jgi:hypothetical protein
LLQGHDLVSGADRDRTGDPLVANQVLSQLSYRPEVAAAIEANCSGSAAQDRRSDWGVKHRQARCIEVMSLPVPARPSYSAQSRGCSMVRSSASNDPGG